MFSAWLISSISLKAAIFSLGASLWHPVVGFIYPRQNWDKQFHGFGNSGKAHQCYCMLDGQDIKLNNNKVYLDTACYAASISILFTEARVQCM